MHDNGVGGDYFDCVALKTYNAAQATEAADTDTAQTGTVSDGWSCGAGASTASAVCKTSGTGLTGTCTCWVYAATGADRALVGLVDVSKIGGCFCPGVGGATWN